VINTQTGDVCLKCTSLKKAKAQVKLLGGALTGREVQEMSKASYKGDKPDRIGDWVLDRELSNSEAAVYYNPSTRKAALALRGSQGATDWLVNNPALALGVYKWTPRYKRGKDIQQKVNNKYGKENVDTVSHSQSGQLAHELNREGLVHSSIEINPARRLGQSVLENETVIRHPLDVVSAFVPTGWNSGKIHTTHTGSSATDVLGNHSQGIIQGEDLDKIYGKGMRRARAKRNAMKAGAWWNDLGHALQPVTTPKFWEDTGKRAASIAIDAAVPTAVGALTAMTGNPGMAPLTSAAASQLVTPQIHKAVGFGRLGDRFQGRAHTMPYKQHVMLGGGPFFYNDFDYRFFHPQDRLLYQEDTIAQPVGRFHLERMPRRYL